MSYSDGIAAINLQMPDRIPRTEYSANRHWALVKEVTKINVDNNSDTETMNNAIKAFEKAWNYDLSWSTDVYKEIFGDLRTSMGHAEYQQGGVDYDNKISCPFEDEADVLAFDPFKAYGERDIDEIVKNINSNYKRKSALHEGQVTMSGIYVSLVSGLLDIFGWDLLLTAMGVDKEGTGRLADRYSDWILQYFKALAKCDSPIIMVHDDIVWTSGPFISRDWYMKYVFGNYEKLFEPLKKSGKKILYTSDGTYTAFIDDIAACGINGFVLEPTTDMEYMAQKYGKCHVIIGNADCRILTYGTNEDIYNEVKRCVDIGRDCPGYFMAVGNHIPSSVPVHKAIYYNEIYQELSIR